MPAYFWIKGISLGLNSLISTQEEIERIYRPSSWVKSHEWPFEP